MLIFRDILEIHFHTKSVAKGNGVARNRAVCWESLVVASARQTLLLLSDKAALATADQLAGTSPMPVC